MPFSLPALSTQNIILDGQSESMNGRAIINSTGSLTVGAGTIFRNFKSTGNAGAIYSKGASLTIGESGEDPVVFVNCTAPEYGGGAVYHDDANDLTIVNTVFGAEGDPSKANYAKGTFGSDAYIGCGGSVYTISKNISITNCQFYGRGTSDMTAAGGGAIYAADASAAMTITRTTFEDMQSQTGGAVYHGGTGKLTITGTRFGALKDSAGNKTAAELSKNDVDESRACKAEGGYNDVDFLGHGGAVFTKSKNQVKVSDSKFLGSVANARGGGIYLAGADTAQRVLTFEDCAFIGNEAMIHYGAAVCEGRDNGRTAKSEIYKNCVFTDQTAKRGGAALLIRPETLTIEGCTFNNCVETGADTVNHYGGAVYVLNNATSLVKDTTFKRCKGADRGGAFYNASTGETASETTLENVSITNGTANSGSAVYTNGNLIIKQSGSGTSEIKGNTAAYDNTGAVQVASGKTMTFEGNVVITGNTNSSHDTVNQHNVILIEDSNARILTTTTGLGTGANIGIYVTGDMNGASGQFHKHGKAGEPFGTYGNSNTGKANLDKFVNDRNALTGAEGTGVYAANIVWETTDVDLTIRAVTDGGMGDTTKEFTYTFTVKDATDTDTYAWKKNGTAQETALTSGGTFTLKHNEMVVISVPVDAEVTVAVDSGTYKTAFAAVKTKDSGASVATQAATEPGTGKAGTVLTIAEATTLTVTNTLGDIAPTGVALRFLPYIFIALAGIGLWLVASKRRG